MFCESGCVTRGRHLDSCSGKDCRGCLPRFASYGVLCRWCWNQLNGIVTDIPGLVEHLAEDASLVLSSPMGKAGGRRPPLACSRMLYPPQLEAADEIVAVFGTWVDQVVEEHPDGLRGPSPIGWRFSDALLRVIDGEMFVQSPQRLGANQAAVDEMSRWVRPFLPWIAEHDWAPEMIADLRPLITTAAARWPWEERVHEVPMPCPICSAWSLQYQPPVVPADPIVVTCSIPDCARRWVGEHWDTVVKAAIASMPKASA